MWLSTFKFEYFWRSLQQYSQIRLTIMLLLIMLHLILIIYPSIYLYLGVSTCICRYLQVVISPNDQ